MGLLDREFRNLSAKDPALKSLLLSWGMGGPTASGRTITEENSLKLSAVWACVDVICAGIGMMPFQTFFKDRSGIRREAIEHPNWFILKTRPNPFMTSKTFRTVLQMHKLLWGNGFAEIERDNAGRTINLWPWSPNRVRMQIIDGRIWYYYLDPITNTEKQRTSTDVLHIKGLSKDGIIGISMIAYQREALGLCDATQEYRARFFKNDARPGGVLEHPGELGGEAQKRLRENIKEAWGGENRRSFAILEEGLKWHDVGIPPNEAQFVEGYVASREEIAGIFHVPPYKIGINKSGTVSYASVEQADLDFWKYCLLPHATDWEQICDGALFTENEKRGPGGAHFYTKLNPDIVLRADSKTRAETLQIRRRAGTLSANEWRGLEDENPIPTNEGGDTYIVEGNMTRLDQVGEPTTTSQGIDPNAPNPVQRMNGVAH